MDKNNVDNFIDSLNQKFSSVVDTVLNHPYLSCIENKELTLEDLKIFVCEQYHIISNDKRNFGLVYSRASNSLSKSLFQYCQSIESMALSNLSLLATELGLTITHLKSNEPIAGCQAYTNYLTKLCSFGSEAEILVAMLVDLPVWGKNCERISTALKKNYGFKEESCIFLDGFASPPPSEEFLKKVSIVIEPYLHNRKKEMETAARLIIDFELMFWDSIYQGSMKEKIEGSRKYFT
jgi:thiaminase